MNIILNLTAEQVSIITMYMAESSGKSVVTHVDIQEELQYNVDNQIKDWSNVVGKTEEAESTEETHHPKCPAIDGFACHCEDLYESKTTTPLLLQDSKTV